MIPADIFTVKVFTLLLVGLLCDGQRPEATTHRLSDESSAQTTSGSPSGGKVQTEEDNHRMLLLQLLLPIILFSPRLMKVKSRPFR